MLTNFSVALDSTVISWTWIGRPKGIFILPQDGYFSHPLLTRGIFILSVWSVPFCAYSLVGYASRCVAFHLLHVFEDLASIRTKNPFLWCLILTNLLIICLKVQQFKRAVRTVSLKARQMIHSIYFYTFPQSRGWLILFSGVDRCDF